MIRKGPYLFPSLISKVVMAYFTFSLVRPCTKWRGQKNQCRSIQYSWYSEVEITWIILIIITLRSKKIQYVIIYDRETRSEEKLKVACSPKAPRKDLVEEEVPLSTNWDGASKKQHFLSYLPLRGLTRLSVASV